jgi:hypothetical protein
MASTMPVMAGKPQKVAENATFTGLGGSSGKKETGLVREGREGGEVVE